MLLIVLRTQSGLAAAGGTAVVGGYGGPDQANGVQSGLVASHRVT